MRLLKRIVAALALLLAAVPVCAQTSAPGSTYRVFLKDGQPLVSYGEAAVVGDRVVFNVVLRLGESQPELQLMSLPAAKVDMERTEKYADAMRASHYAATRGEADYEAVTAEVSRALDLLATVPDRRRRLVLAEQARERLLAWSRDNFRYRERDIQVLSGLFDEVIGELRAAVGQSTFSLDFVAGGATFTREPLLAQPTHSDLIALALAAADAADVVDERLALLRSAERVLVGDLPASELRVAVAARLREEVRINEAYAALRADLLGRAAGFRVRGDVAAVERLRAELEARDRQLGALRAAQAQSIARELTEILEGTRVQRVALDHYAYVRRSLVAFEQRTRPVLTAVDGLSPVLRFIRDGKSMAYSRVVGAEARLKALLVELRAVSAPADLQGVHATLVSAVTMAREACARRRQAVVTNKPQIDREASSAAAGALMLAVQVRRDLLEGLRPPRVPLARGVE